MLGVRKGWRNCFRRTAAVAIACVTLLSQTGCRAEVPWPLWQSYRAKFVDASGRVIDHDANERTTSEGMAYGMFFALVTNDRPTFDKMLRWTEDNLAGGDLTARLPAWNWGKSPEGQWKTLDANSAADADLWMAYDLVEAGRMWKDDRLAKLGTVLANHIAQSEVALIPGLGAVLLPGPQGFHPDQNIFILNPSYTPPQVVARLRFDSPTGPWASLLESYPMLVQGSSPAGYAMDWVTAGTGVRPSGTPAQLATGKTDFTPIGAYEAIRVYLWLGMADKGTVGISESLGYLQGMGRYMQTAPTPPLQVDSTGKILNPEGTVGFSAAMIPYLVATGRMSQAKSQNDRLTASKDSATGLYGHSSLYYDQNLAMFATGWQEGRFHFDRDGKLRLKWK
ncbi:cellulose synthase complex periplasmic endoglucanase BcsZ [Terriglobus sp. TAA 43]|uniref:cellulose synthase complex periplasmic endoglucanase BcsZ n=1 Tax=Terriglobus sp. TAA 43 TaxID=278961 RepID=UPI0006457351|nr:cellulose synthase complex periplasmic endoglucanase BcsZ [Terriglobus sp. TAA 43]